MPIPLMRYRLRYTPGATGRVDFYVANDQDVHTTAALTAAEFSALALVLSQKNLEYDPNTNTFSSRDTNEPL